VRPTLIALLLGIFFSACVAGPGPDDGATVPVAQLTRSIPARRNQNLTGSQFAQYVSRMNSEQREQAIEEEILKGNIPQFLTKLVPVVLTCRSSTAASLTATIFVAPDYLAIGSDDDFLRIPMNLHTAITIADRFGFILPTRKMVDAIYLQSRYHLVPQPLMAGPLMRSTQYYSTHNRMIEEQAKMLGEIGRAHV